MDGDWEDRGEREEVALILRDIVEQVALVAFWLMVSWGLLRILL